MATKKKAKPKPKKISVSFTEEEIEFFLTRERDDEYKLMRLERKLVRCLFKRGAK